MAITESTIEYNRSPSVPSDEEGRIKYIMEEFDKIAFTLVNIQYDLNQILVALDARLTIVEGP